MKDRFKFRAWDGEEMVHDVGIANGKAVDYDEARMWYWDEQPQVLMQSTGLRDKNGTLIFEGDIVRTTEYLGGNFIDNIIEKYQIIFQGFGFTAKPIGIKGCQYTVSMGWGEAIDIEIIGNIYENPELLS